MTVFYCAACGHRGTAADITVSYSNNPYCRDGRACEKRREARLDASAVLAGNRELSDGGW